MLTQLTSVALLALVVAIAVLDRGRGLGSGLGLGRRVGLGHELLHHARLGLERALVLTCGRLAEDVDRKQGRLGEAAQGEDARKQQGLGVATVGVDRAGHR